MQGPTEREVRVLLDEVTRKFAAKFPDHSYDYQVARYINTSGGTNWHVHGSGSTHSSGGGLWRYNQALDEIHDQHPIIV